MVSRRKVWKFPFAISACQVQWRVSREQEESEPRAGESQRNDLFLKISKCRIKNELIVRIASKCRASTLIVAVCREFLLPVAVSSVSI